jgi:uncharacterized membrane protein HdeD (DUF308 family)
VIKEHADEVWQLIEQGAIIVREERVGKMIKKSVNDLTREWWSVALRGAVAVLAGVVIVVSPIPHRDHLLRVFGAYMLVDGIIGLITAAQAARRRESWRRPVADGILGILVGMVNLIGGGLPALVRADLIALRTFVQGVSGILVARQLRTELPETLPQWLLMLCGIGSVIFSVIIVVGPAIEARVLGRLDWLACVYLVGFGLLLLTLAARLRTLSRGPRSTSTLPAAAP